MSEERAESAAAGAAAAGSQVVSDVLGKLLDVASVKAAFSQPQTVDGRTVILAADVTRGMGFGSGEGPQGTGGGAGGGGARSRPLAAIVAGPEGVETRPIFDANSIALPAVTTLGFSLCWLLRAGRLAEGAGSEKLASPRAFRGLIGAR